VQAFEVGHFRLISGLDQHLETSLNQRGGSAAENRLFAKKVGLGLFLERGLEDAGARASDPLCPGESDLLLAARRVIVNRDQGRNAFSFLVLLANDVAGTFARHHDNVDIFWLID